MLILIVEDDYNDYLFAKTLLKIANIDFLWAEDGANAIALCKKCKNIDLVLMDIRLPVMDGFEATKRIKSIRKELPVIAVTAYAMANDRENALNKGCDDYVSKPYKSKELFRIIKKWTKTDMIFPEINS